jgi:hypothetical protein
MFFVGLREDEDVFYYSTAVFEVVKDLRHAAAVVIACEADAERETLVLITAKWGRKSGHLYQFIIQEHLVVTFKGVDDGEEMHACWDRPHRLKWRICFKTWTDNTFV